MGTLRGPRCVGMANWPLERRQLESSFCGHGSSASHSGVGLLSDLVFFTPGLERLRELRKGQGGGIWASSRAPEGRWGIGCLKHEAVFQLVPELVGFA